MSPPSNKNLLGGGVTFFTLEDFGFTPPPSDRAYYVNLLLDQKNVLGRKAGARSVGMFVEDVCGVIENNSASFDLPHIETDLKSYRTDSGSDLTLLTKSPCKGNFKDLVTRYGYIDAKGRHAYKRDITATSADLFLSCADDFSLQIQDRETGEIVAYWGGDIIQRIFTKMTNILLVGTFSWREGDDEFFTVKTVTDYRGFQINRFMDLVSKGVIVLNPRCHFESSGSFRDRGSAFRISRKHLDDLYSYSKKYS